MVVGGWVGALLVVSVMKPEGSLFRSCGEVSWFVILLVVRNL